MLSDREDIVMRSFVRRLLRYPQHIDDFRVMLNRSSPTIRKYMKILMAWDWAYRTDDGKYALQQHAVPYARKYLGMDEE